LYQQDRDITKHYLNQILVETQNNISKITIGFPSDRSVIIDKMLAGKCEEAARLLAEPNNEIVVPVTDANMIVSDFNRIKEAILQDVNKYKGRYIVYTRHFIPEFRDGFYAYLGDGRGFSNIPNESNYDDNNWETNSSRVIIRNLVEFDTKKIGIVTPYCDPTILFGIIRTSAIPRVSKKHFELKGANLAYFDLEYTASDPLAFGLAPVLNYNLSIEVKLIESFQTLKVTIKLDGDPYPAGEMFILDTKNKQSWFLDTYAIPKKLEIISSYPENEFSLVNSTTYFKINESGSIISAFKDGLPISQFDWNNIFNNRTTRK